MVTERLLAAANAHDLEALVACFSPDYQLEMPAHPSRNFRGNEQVRKNWEGFFAAMPDMQCSAADERRRRGVVGVGDARHPA